MRTRLQTQKRESAAVGGTDFGYSGLVDGLRKVRAIASASCRADSLAYLTTSLSHHITSSHT